MATDVFIELPVRTVSATIVAPIPLPVVTQNAVTTPTIFHLSMPLANTEYSYALPVNSKTFSFQTKSFTIKLAYTAGQSGTDFWTVQRNNWLTEDNIIAANLTLYVQSPNAGVTLEIKSWQ